MLSPSPQTHMDWMCKLPRSLKGLSENKVLDQWLKDFTLLVYWCLLVGKREMCRVLKSTEECS